ncbi:GNAT family N-acetyltransferase [Corynebacterium epidermidicanis]|uniref:Acyl-CoA synthetase (NDP forming) n=1 Tax=Corynebacterium epidermidicanis TaxID=1050174 RepID=A0A0G3GSP6_9CORY|nr:GNAT family N-acetyltransferase [Corynebacterium epidermidicanis]AKK04109.1 acyl-CoA synthetase (NDP forming) [Corynebacterium epidermidicanis]
MKPELRWEADVILNDGGIATLRPVQPTDRDALIEFYSRVSDKSKYLRFFTTHPELTAQDLTEWVEVDQRDQVTLVLIEREDIVATARYALVSGHEQRTADVSFLVQDDHHGRGIANILLEHLAQIGRENDVKRFFAEMLTQNRSMVQTFIRAGYSVKPELEDGYITVDFPIDPTDISREVMERRELRAEATSIRRLLNPAQDTDLVIATYNPDTFDEVLDQAAQQGARGIISLADGHNPALTAQDLRDFVAQAREHGLRALGPASLGIINTRGGLNTTPAPMPRTGNVGLFTQSAGISTLALSHAIERGVGISTFISAGAFADVTGNDVIQFWADDPDTNICLLSLDTVGNPRKFFRVLRRLALEKQVVVFIPSRALKSARYLDDPGISTLNNADPSALDAVIRSSGAMVVTRRDTMFDLAQLLARQPVPAGRRVAVISNSAGLSEQMAQSAQRFGLNPRAITVTGDPVSGLLEVTTAALADDSIDAVLSGLVEISTAGQVAAAHRGLSELATTTVHKPLIGTFVGFGDLPEDDADTEHLGQLPVFGNYADALEALSLIVSNEEARAAARPQPEDEVGSGRRSAAREFVASLLSSSPAGRELSDVETAHVLRLYGINLIPWQPVSTLAEAIVAAEEYGWDVVLKNVHPALRGRPELSAVVRHIGDSAELATAWNTLERMSADLGLDAFSPVVQPTVPPGTTLTIRAIEDPVLGPISSVGIAGPISELLKDKSYGVPPLRRRDAHRMLTSLAASELLRGHRGTPPALLEPAEYVIMQVNALKDDVPALVEIELTPVIVGAMDTAVVGARMRIADIDTERDPLARRLR